MTAITTLAESFARSQRAEGRSPHTIHLYQQCIRRLVPFVREQAASDDVAAATRRVLTDFYAVRTETVAPATVWTDWKVHRVFLQWCLDEGEISEHPMARMKPPKQPIRPVPVLSRRQLSDLIAACEGATRRDRRDLAIMRLAIDTGVRRGEIAGLQVPDVDLDAGMVRVTGKGRTRVVPIGAKTAAAIDRHLRTSRPAGSVFGLTPSGVAQAFTERARRAGVPAHLHQLRHSFAHWALVAGMTETDLMTLAGWSPGSRSMLDRYGASARVERAIAAHRRLSPGDSY